MLAAAEPDETHLVLSCSQSVLNISANGESFACTNHSHLLLTKLDYVPRARADVVAHPRN